MESYNQLGDLQGGDAGPWGNSENIDWENPLAGLPPGMPRPIMDRIIIMPYVPPAKTKGGIILTDSSKDAQEYLDFRGVIVAMGPLAFETRSTRSIEMSQNVVEIRKATAIDEKGRELTTTTTTTRIVDIYDDDESIPTVGSWVTFGRYQAHKLEYHGIKLIECRPQDIMSLIDGPDGYKAYV